VVILGSSSLLEYQTARESRKHATGHLEIPIREDFE
jgi:hypothetical protein